MAPPYNQALVDAAVGVALAGGESSRMGRDKALLVVDGQTLLESAVERLAQVTGRIVVADRGRGFPLPPGATAVPDGPGRGPAAGILGAAAAHPGRSLLVLACDMPNVPVAFLQRLIQTSSSAQVVPDLVIPDLGDDDLQPTCALYGPAALAALDGQVRQGRYSLRRLAQTPALEIHRLEIHRLTRTELFSEQNGISETAGNQALDDIFRNLNTPQDLDF